MKNIWLDGIMGVIVGDALGVPVEFMSRENLTKNPVCDMRGYGTYNLPKGSWSDDSSMTLATLDSLKTGYNPDDIMEKFRVWLDEGEYTPFGEVFDCGMTCSRAIKKYEVSHDWNTCGGYSELDNGNGSLMRIMPACLHFYEKQKTEGLSDEEVIEKIHEVSALTHGHLRSKIACGLYYFIVRSILNNSGTLHERLQAGLDEGFAYYEKDVANLVDLSHYENVRNLAEFARVPEAEIKSTGYVVATFEAALWCLVNTESYENCTLKAVNLGDDTDTVAAVAGGFAGLYYGYEDIPQKWIMAIQKRDWIKKMCG